MTDINEIDFASASLDDLDNLTMDDVLGNSLADVEMSNSLPECVAIFQIAKMSLAKKAADPDKGKQASVTLIMSAKVIKCLTCADSSVDPESLTGRFHTQRFMVSRDFGKQQLAKFILGVIGISYRDKTAIAEVAGAQSEILEELMATAVPFGATIKNKEADGFENSDFVFSEKAFIPSETAMEQLD